MYSRSYGGGFISANTDGVTVVAVTSAGRIHEYRNGSLIRAYGSGVTNAYVIGQKVYASTTPGKVVEYRNGMYQRQH